jgi:hypothetical protein
MAVAGNIYAQQWVVAAQNLSIANGDDISGVAITTAVDILTTKMKTYEKWNATYPGYGGYFPWVFVYDDRIEPSPDWQSPTYRVPALDNGELIWTLLAASAALTKAGYTSLGDRYQRYFQLMADTSVMIFHDGDGHIRGVTHIIDPKAKPTVNNYELARPCGDPCFLDDPYEGELMAFFMDLYGTWPNVCRHCCCYDCHRLWLYQYLMLYCYWFDVS